MQTPRATLTKPRVGFLLVLAIGITLLFYRVIHGSVLTVFMAAILAGLFHPFYQRLMNRLGHRKSLCASTTVALSTVLVVIPMILFVGILVTQAIGISESAGLWVTRQLEDPGGLTHRIQENPVLQKLLPYQHEIVTKAGQLAAKAGSSVASGLAAGAKGTASFFLLLFVMLYALFFFLINGRTTLHTVLQYTPLSRHEKSMLIGTFASVARATLKGTMIIGLVQGALAGLAFWIAGIQGAVFWGAVMAVLSIIPGLGTAIIWVPAVAYLWMNGQTAAALGVGLWCALVVGTADNVLRPRLVGKDTKMPDLLVVLSTLGGLTAFGAAGIVIGPIVGALFITVWRLWADAVREDDGESPELATGLDDTGAPGARHDATDA